jgi:hypothetical protein
LFLPIVEEPALVWTSGDHEEDEHRGEEGGLQTTKSVMKRLAEVDEGRCRPYAVLEVYTHGGLDEVNQSPRSN